VKLAKSGPVSENGEIEVCATIKNTGHRTGKEVLQVYVGKDGSQVERAKKELKGFKKIELAAGLSSTVRIKIPVSSLSYFNESTHKWEVEKGGYTVYVGTASDDISGELAFEVK
ncbi:MAG: fibronectin type III-like domain-contianing protein, partial [Bacteroidales bacterium]|nr:fibronectin type III-like domain-contianing protein [Bacteroidales bacterium]